MSSTEPVVLCQQVTQPPSSSHTNHNNDIDAKPSSSKQVDKNKRHNNRGRNKKKNPNVINATEVGTSSSFGAAINEEPNSDSKKPANRRTGRNQQKSNNSTPVNRFSKNRAQGRLTEENDEQASTQQSNSKKNNRNNNNRSRKNHSKLPPGEHDMATLLAHELKTSTYECMICMDVVRPAHHVWTCDCCWAVFHLNCVQTWATRSLKGK
jgi:transcriptional repressor NF-X1